MGKPEDDKPSTPMPTRALRVLVVEDEQRLRDLLLEVLPDMGFPAPVGVRSAEEAMRLMESDPAPRDIILLDLQLPAMGGMDLFEKIRSRWPRTQVIIMTGFGDLEAAQHAIHLDVVEFLTKPCPLRDIELALERARRRVHASERNQADLIIDSPHKSASKPSTATTLWEAERQQILAALARNKGNRTAAAAELGISRRTLHYRLNEYRSRGLGIEPKE